MALDEDGAAFCELHHEIPLPFYIDFGRDFVLLPCFGALLNPYAGLVGQLKRVFKSDWDRAVDGREAIFRLDLRRAFPEPRFLVPEVGFALRKPNGEPLTDIDAVIVDRDTGGLALVQLKWHDIFGRSLRERNSRMLNLLSANNWVERVSNWIAGRSAEEVADALNVVGRGLRGSPFLMVLARHSSHFTNVDAFDHRAAWLGWANILQILRRSSESDPLCQIFREFRGGGAVASSSPHAYESHERFEFPGLTVEVLVG